MIKKVIIFCPNQTDIYEVGNKGVTHIAVDLHEVKVDFKGSTKVYMNMPHIYDVTREEVKPS